MREWDLSLLMQSVLLSPIEETETANTYIKLIGIGVLISMALGAWAVYELTSMKTEIASLIEDVYDVLKEVKRVKARPVRKARPEPQQPENV